MQVRALTSLHLRARSAVGRWSSGWPCSARRGVCGWTWSNCPTGRGLSARLRPARRPTSTGAPAADLAALTGASPADVACGGDGPAVRRQPRRRWLRRRCTPLPTRAPRRPRTAPSPRSITGAEPFLPAPLHVPARGDEATISPRSPSRGSVLWPTPHERARLRPTFRPARRDRGRACAGPRRGLDRHSVRAGVRRRRWCLVDTPEGTRVGGDPARPVDAPAAADGGLE